ncbi:GntR family transcriptional regulator [Pseudaminobacter arsenicus]|uniref:GntR family transcriptional regulator n=1 Tax=Borborobacter arsenicus TaxID=1851146 RepID=A0A432V3B2_9HYPH|nr:GntR family transcriptional regulator [Pseudaminobacter arsenicus]RUM96694.1 GntR family transcriptional regulator [Pseudaminobacter arsenicus]
MENLTDQSEQGRVRGATVDYLLHRVRQGILQGLYAPGQRLIEADLTREFGVSRGPLREALHRLAADNLLEIVPNRGAIVRRLSMREMLELFSIRIALECLAVQEGTANLSDQAIRARFETDIQPIWLPEQRVPSGDYIAENKAFHDAIIRASGNETLAVVTNQLQLPLLMFQLSKKLTIANIAASLNEHRSIAQAMLDGDATAAETRMRQHLERARSIAFEMPSQVFRAEPKS